MYLLNFTLIKLLKDNKMTENKSVVARVGEIDYKREEGTFGGAGDILHLD